MESKLFTFENNYIVVCRSESTRYGFRHLAELFQHGYSVAKGKMCYYNRTWESYEFESVLKQVLLKLPEEEREKALNKLVVQND